MLTNGRRWLQLFQAPDPQKGGNRSYEVDIARDPVAASEGLNRYLSRDRVVSGQAALAAEMTLRDQSRETVTRQAVLDGWRQVVLGFHDGLLELKSTSGEQRTGYRPEIRRVRRALTDSRAELLPQAEGQRGRASASFTFLSETRPVSSWPDLLVQVRMVMSQRHPGEFERILKIRGRKNPFFSRSAEDFYVPKPVGETGLYASCQGGGSLLEQRARRVVDMFGYSAESLTIEHS